MLTSTFLMVVVLVGIIGASASANAQTTLSVKPGWDVFDPVGLFNLPGDGVKFFGVPRFDMAAYPVIAGTVYLRRGNALETISSLAISLIPLEEGKPILINSHSKGSFQRGPTATGSSIGILLAQAMSFILTTCHWGQGGR